MGEQKRKGKPKRYRNRQSKPFVTTVIVILCFVIIGVADYVSRSKNSPLTKFDSVRSKGDQDAPLRILEFVDFQCPECARGSKLIRSYMMQYPKSIFLAVKYYPLGELNSMVSALYAECAAEQGKFWSMHDSLFDRQRQWRTLREAKSLFNSIARDVRLDIDELELCMKGGNAQSVILAERMLGESHFVKSTPTYFVNDEMVVGVEALREQLEAFFSKQDGEAL